MAVHETNKKLTCQNIRKPHLPGIGWVLGMGKQEKKSEWLMLTMLNKRYYSRHGINQVVLVIIELLGTSWPSIIMGDSWGLLITNTVLVIMIPHLWGKGVVCGKGEKGEKEEQFNN